MLLYDYITLSKIKIIILKAWINIGLFKFWTFRIVLASFNVIVIYYILCCEIKTETIATHKFFSKYVGKKHIFNIKYLIYYRNISKNFELLIFSWTFFRFKINNLLFKADTYSYNLYLIGTTDTHYREILINDDLLSHVTDYISKHISI